MIFGTHDAKLKVNKREKHFFMGYPALDLKGKTAVVIGGTSGIGLTLAKGLAQAGANVVPTGRRSDLVKSAVEQVRSLGRKSLAIPADVTDKSSLEALLNAVQQELGSVEILVNCAGRTKRTPTLEVSADEWDCILRLNLTELSMPARFLAAT